MMTALSVLTKGALLGVRARFRGRRSCPKKLSSSTAARRGVRVGAADQAELVGIDAELLFQLQTILQRRAGVLEFQHFRLLQLGQIQVALVPTFEVGEFIVGRQEGVRLAVALDLRRFIEWLPADAVLGILAINLLAGERFDDREHAAIA